MFAVHKPHRLVEGRAALYAVQGDRYWPDPLPQTYSWCRYSLQVDCPADDQTDVPTRARRDDFAYNGISRVSKERCFEDVTILNNATLGGGGFTAAACLASDGDIICTQPRRIAATSLARRVASERGERVGERGSMVGYQVRLESKRTESTRLLFCTTGIALRMMLSEPPLQGISHVVVDEVHERDTQTDQLLLLLRELLPRRRDLKVILMSATVQAELFSKYFDG